MRDFLLFQLHGAFASWGDVAVGEARGSATAPGRSAILGVIGAALGIKADAVEELQKLDDSVHVGVRTDSAGIPLTDFHTTQTSADPSPVASRQASLLRDPAPATVVSRRDYRIGGCWTVVLEGRDRAPVALTTIAQAIRKPGFALYLGRKACPPGLPANPVVIRAATAIEALDQYPLGVSLAADDSTSREFLSDFELTVGDLAHERLRRRDLRTAWVGRVFEDRWVRRARIVAAGQQEAP